MGRATQGVTLIAVEDGTKLSGLQRIVETDLEEVVTLPGALQAEEPESRSPTVGNPPPPEESTDDDLPPENE